MSAKIAIFKVPENLPKFEWGTKKIKRELKSRKTI